MKINLDFLLRKKNLSLKDFCNLNELKNYKSLKLYCESKNMICVSELFYNEKMHVNIITKEKEQLDGIPGEKSEPKTQKRKTKSRRPSETPKVTKKRPARTKSNT